jgi:hypothetical protein
MKEASRYLGGLSARYVLGVSLASQPSPIALNEDDADKNDDEAGHQRTDHAGHRIMGQPSGPNSVHVAQS